MQIYVNTEHDMFHEGYCFSCHTVSSGDKDYVIFGFLMSGQHLSPSGYQIKKQFLDLLLIHISPLHFIYNGGSKFYK